MAKETANRSHFVAGIVFRTDSMETGKIELLVVCDKTTGMPRFPGGGVEDTDSDDVSALGREFREEVTDHNPFIFRTHKLVHQVKVRDDKSREKEKTHTKSFYLLVDPHISEIRSGEYREGDGVVLLPPRFLEAKQLFEIMSRDTRAGAHRMALIKVLAMLAKEYPPVADKYMDIIVLEPAEDSPVEADALKE